MIDPAKTYRTRDGREVRIYAVDGANPDNIHGAVKSERGWSVREWFPEGNYLESEDHPTDLIEVKPKHVRWVNVYSGPACSIGYKTRKEADDGATNARIGCIRIEFEEGEGL